MTANPLPPISAIGTPTGAANPIAAGARLKPIDPMRVLRQNLRLFVITAIAGVVLGVGTWGVLQFTMPRYRSMAQLQVNPALSDPRQEVTPHGQTSGNLSVVEAYIMNQVVLVTSQPVLDAVLSKTEVRDQLEWAKPYHLATGFDLAKAREDLREIVNAYPVRGSTMFQVAVTNSNKNEARLLLNHIITEYHRAVERMNTSQTSAVKATFSNFLLSTERDLNRLQQQMAKFIEDNGITHLELEKSEIFGTLNELAKQRAIAAFEAEQAQAAYQAAVQAANAANLAPSPDELWIIEQAQPVAQRMERLRALREQRQIMLLQLREQHPSIKMLDKQIEAVEQELAQEQQRQLQQLRAVRMEQAAKALQAKLGEVEALEPKLIEAQVKMIDMNVKLQQFEQLKLQHARKEHEHQEITNLLNNIDALERREDSRRVVTAVPPTEAELVFPKPQIMIPGITVLTLLAVGGFIFLREMLDQRIKAPSDVKLLPDVELLGMLPDAEEDVFGQGDLAGAVRRDPAGLLAESFRQVRTSLLSRMDRRGYKTLLIVGAQPGAGVSAVTANLAASLAFNGRRVLVLDANFRRPSQHRQFDINPDAPGLADVLNGRASADDVIVHVTEPDIDILPAGTTAAAYPEQLEGPAFRSLLANLEARYDIILIDAPPALLTSDASLLAKQVDAIAIVVRAMQQKRGMIERMLRQLDGHRGDVLGIILNGVRASAGGYFRKSYKAFYEYSRTGNGHAGNGRATTTPARRRTAARPTIDETELAEARHDADEDEN